jgi:hypothetical protein
MIVPKAQQQVKCASSDMNSRIASITIPRHLTEIINPQVTNATVHLNSNNQQLLQF